jgi:tetratricopeptide (TPR) repeat protein
LKITAKMPLTHTCQTEQPFSYRTDSKPKAGFAEQPTIAHSPAAHPGSADAVDTDLPLQGALSTKLSVSGPAYFQAVARLGEQAALALDHAHQRGIVHRDIKPANLLLDADGTLWVTDFGLAQIQSDTRLTLTGDLVGTLRYMSPEQALAQRVVVDHRTDIYSLGATLYELLTLEPVFAGQDRQELLRQIAFEEPRAPRRLDRAIPAVLEVIVLKALQKNPADRYATAQELAEDLRRYLKDEPIRARRPSLAQRAGRWSRRHQPLVWSAAVGVIILAASVGWIVRDRVTRHQQMRSEVAYALQGAEGDLKAAKWVESRAAVERARSLLATGARDEQLSQRAADLLTDLDMVATIQLIRLEAAAVKKNHFDNEGANARYGEAFRAYDLDVDALPAEVAVARIRQKLIAPELVVALDYWAGSRPAGEPQTKHLLAIAGQADPDDDPWRRALRMALEQGEPHTIQRLAAEVQQQTLSPSTVLLLAHALVDQKALYERQVSNRGSAHLARVLLRKVQQDHPDDFWINHTLAVYLHYIQPPRLDAAVGFYPDAYNNLGLALKDQGDWAGAGAAFRKMIDLKPDSAPAHNNMALFLITSPIAGLRDPKLALTHAERATALAPNEWWPWTSLGMVRYRNGNWAAALAALTKSIKLPNGGESNNFFFLAMVHWRLGHKDTAGVYFHKAVLWMDEHEPKDEELRRFRAEAAALLGVKDDPKAQAQDKPAPKP